MRVIWLVMLLLSISVSIGCANAFDKETKSQDILAGEGNCNQIKLENLPIDKDSLRKKIIRLIGYENFAYENFCKFGDNYLIRVVPPKEKRHGIFTILLELGASGEIKIIPSE